MGLMGRAAELRASREVVTSGRAAILRGPAGIGKTSLALELANGLRDDGWLVEVTAPTAAGRATPFGPFLYLQDPTSLPSQSTAEQLVRLGAQLRRRKADHDLLLVIDDAHLLDDASVLLVHQLAARREASLVLAARTPEPIPADILRLVKDGHAVALDIGPLTRPDGDRLVRSLLPGSISHEVLDEVWRVSAGNPLFAKELVTQSRERRALVRDADGPWALAAPLAASDVLWDVIGRRIHDTDDESRHLLECVAVAGPLRVSIAERILTLDRVDELERAGFATVDRRGDDLVVDVAHPLYAEIIRERSSEARLRQARRRVADLLQEIDSDRSTDLLLLARLRLDSGDADASLLVAAAQRAFECLDGPLALRCAEALAALGAGNQAEVLRASALGTVGRLDEARAVFEVLEAQSADPSERAAVAFQHAQFLLYREGSVANAGEVLKRAISALPPEAAGPAASYLSWVTFLGGRPHEAVEIAERLLADEHVPVVFGGGPAFASAQAVLGNPDSALDVVRRAFAELDSDDLGTGMDVTVLAVNFMWIRILGCWQVGRVAETDNPFAPFRVPVAARLEGGAIDRYGMRATQQFVRGHLDAALEDYARLGPELQAAPLPVSVFTSALLATVHAFRGDAESAHAVLDFVDRTLRPELAVYRWWIERARAFAAAAAGDRPLAIQLTLDLVEEVRDQPFPLTTSLHDLVRLGQCDLVVEQLATQADRDGATWWDRVCAAHARAAHERDPDGLLAASQAFEDGGIDLQALEAAAQAATRYQEQGRAVEAAAAQARVRVVEARCGTVGTPPLDAVPSMLTTREHEVARLAARGVSNREIADRFGTSPRTVGNQLQRVYDKLGVHTRTELAALLEPDSR